MARGQRSRRRRRQTSSGGIVERVWAFATSVRTLGVLLVLGGVLLATTPWSRTPTPLVVSWWDSAFYAPDVLRVAAGFAGAVLVLMLGVLWNRYRLATDPAAEARSVKENAGSDARFEDETASASVKESRLPGMAWAGATCMVAGIAVLVGYWFFAQQNLGVAQVPIAVSETIDHYRIPYGNEGLDVMLPLRVRLSGLDAGDEPTARLQLFEAGQNPPEPQSIAAGSGLDVDGFRLTFSGLKPDVTKLKAVFGSSAPGTISAGAAEGETFRLSLDGPEYKVLEVSRNYLGAMGPAAKVRAPEVGEFWVFQSASDAKVKPELGHPIELDHVQTQPAAIFSIARAQPFWPISLGGTLFVLGFALLIVFPERIVRQGDGAVCVWSFNEAGRVAEQTLDQINPDQSEPDQNKADQNKADQNKADQNKADQNKADKGSKHS